MLQGDECADSVSQQSTIIATVTSSTSSTTATTTTHTAQPPTGAGTASSQLVEEEIDLRRESTQSVLSDCSTVYSLSAGGYVEVESIPVPPSPTPSPGPPPPPQPPLLPFVTNSSPQPFFTSTGFTSSSLNQEYEEIKREARERIASLVREAQFAEQFLGLRSHQASSESSSISKTFEQQSYESINQREESYQKIQQSHNQLSSCLEEFSEEMASSLLGHSSQTLETGPGSHGGSHAGSGSESPNHCSSPGSSSIAKRNLREKRRATAFGEEDMLTPQPDMPDVNPLNEFLRGVQDSSSARFHQGATSTSGKSTADQFGPGSGSSVNFSSAISSQQQQSYTAKSEVMSTKTMQTHSAIIQPQTHSQAYPVQAGPPPGVPSQATELKDQSTLVGILMAQLKIKDSYIENLERRLSALEDELRTIKSHLPRVT